MDLKEIKEKIRVETVNPQNNEKLKGWLTDLDDCFGRGYDEGGRYCRECTALADVDGKKEPINVFCRELTKSAKVVEQEEEPKATKRFRRF